MSPIMLITERSLFEGRSVIDYGNCVRIAGGKTSMGSYLVFRNHLRHGTLLLRPADNSDDLRSHLCGSIGVIQECGTDAECRAWRPVRTILAVIDTRDRRREFTRRACTIRLDA